MASRRARLSEDGRRDLALIFSHTSAEWGIEQARRYRRTLKATCERIGEFPEIGVAEPGLEGVRTFVAQQHRIVYRVTDRGVLILRFVHQRMDKDDIGLI